MAEMAMNTVIQQLATLLIAEVNKLRGARDRVVSIQRDLEFICAFLKDADQQQHSKEATKVWVKQVREIAYSIEDVLDTFSYRMGRPSGSGLAGFYRTSTRFIRRQYALRWVSGEVDGLGSQLCAISARRNDFGLAEASNRVAADGMPAVQRQASMFVEQSQIVGIDKPKREIIDRLLDGEKWKYGVVSLDGMGGLGKTTLARKVYEDPVLKQNFSCLARHVLLSTYRSLKVLHLESVGLGSFPAAILELFHLRYLHMREANISSLPEDISRLRNLLTLDLKWNPISSLPHGILKLKNLRHILIYKTLIDGVELPKKFGSLTSLQKLRNVKITGGDAQFDELSKLNQLTKLAIVKFSPDDGEALRRAIENMSYLQSLLLYPGEDDQFLPVDELYVNSPFLTSIHLRGLLNALPMFILSLKCLEKLQLSYSKLETDIFMSLQHLPCLMELDLHDESYQGKCLRTERGGFKKLRKIYIGKAPMLRQVVIAEGAMPNLVYLELFECDSLESVPAGIEHLKNLKEFVLRGGVECLKRIKKDEGEDWDRVKHIPLVLQELYKDEDGELQK